MLPLIFKLFTRVERLPNDVSRPLQMEILLDEADITRNISLSTTNIIENLVRKPLGFLFPFCSWPYMIFIKGFFYKRAFKSNTDMDVLKKKSSFIVTVNVL